MLHQGALEVIAWTENLAGSTADGQHSSLTLKAAHLIVLLYTFSIVHTAGCKHTVAVRP
jgi:hypothetical protein